MNKRLFTTIFIAILFLGTFLRFYQLGSVPGSLEWDEVSFGYNAYSILNIGKDEYGKFLPTVFKAFGEYKQPVYMYLDVVSVLVFGLTSFAVRFPSALFGSVGIIFVFLLTREIFNKFDFRDHISLLSMLFFAVSPWSIQFSRGAFEANVSLTFVIIGIWCFLRGINIKKNLFIFLSAFFLSLSAYTYLSQKLIAPILFVLLIIYGYKYLKKNKFVLGLLVLFFAVLNIFWVLDSRTVTRGQGVLFTSNQTEILAPSLRDLQYDNLHNDLGGKILHNRRIVYMQKLGSNYLSHFNPIWLFYTGDSVNRHHPPGMGLLYLASIPLILAGIYFLLSRTLSASWIIFALFLLAPIPASLTFEAPHSLRSLIFLPTWQIFEAAGFIFLFQHIGKKRFAYIVKGVLITLLVINVFFYLHQYFIHTNTDFQSDWQYGYKEAIEYVNNLDTTGKRVVFASDFEQPYIFYLFYTKYNPKKYLQTGGSNRISEKCYEIENAYFGDCKNRLRTGDIYVSTGQDNISGRTLKEFKYETGETSTGIYEYK